MRTGPDAHRSLKVYVAEALGEGWDVREAAEKGTFERPIAQIEATTPSSLVAGTPHHRGDYTRGFAVYTYPVGYEGEVRRSLQEAQRIERLLDDAFSVGIGDGHPQLIPLYDFEDVPMDEPSEARTPHDFMRITSLDIDHEQSVEAEHLFTVFAELRVSWSRVRLRPDQSRTARRVDSSFTH